MNLSAIALALALVSLTPSLYTVALLVVVNRADAALANARAGAPTDLFGALPVAWCAMTGAAAGFLGMLVGVILTNPAFVAAGLSTPTVVGLVALVTLATASSLPFLARLTKVVRADLRSAAALRVTQ